MILVFGGAYQGKLAYVMERFGFEEDDVYRCRDDDAAVPEGRRVIYELDKWILALVKTDVDSSAAVKSFVADNSFAVVVCNDISCGVVPEDPVCRKWREATGRALAEIASASEEVIRVFCGIARNV